MIANRISSTEKVICFTSLAVMAILPVLDAILRPFNLVIPYSSFFIQRVFLISALFAASLCTGEKDHISIQLLQFAKNPVIKTAFSIFTNLLSSLISIVLFWDTVSFAKYLAIDGSAGGFIPEWVFAIIISIVFALMAIKFGLNSIPVNEDSRKFSVFHVLPFLVFILGCIAAMPAIVKIFWGMEGEINFTPPEILYNLVNDLYDFAFNFRTPLIILLVISALSGTPIFIVIGGIALIMYQSRFLEPDIGLPHIHSALTDGNMIAIPLFTLTGFFLSESKSGERLVKAFRSIFSWLPGGMVIATVIICAFFTSFTGASGVTILALGGILYTILKDKLNYPENFSIGLLTSAGNVGLLFPPSFIIILVASTITSVMVFMGETPNFDIFDFFIGALIPGIILVLTRIIIGLFVSVKIKIPVEPFKIREAASAIKESIFEILLPLILIIGYISGILPSLIEISAVSVVYIFIVEVFIHKDIAIKDIGRVFSKAVPIVGGILIILSMAKAFSHVFIDSGYPEQFTDWIQRAVESKVIFLLLLNLALLVLGCFVDIFSAIAVALPLIVPLALAYEINPIHLGIIFIINMEVGYLTPPVGLNLYLASYRFNKPFLKICRYVLPFLISQLLVVILITYVPWFSTILVDLFR